MWKGLEEEVHNRSKHVELIWVMATCDVSHYAGKVKAAPAHAMKAYGGVVYSSTHS